MNQPEGLHELADLHVYSDEHIVERLRFRPRHPLHVLVARATRLREPIHIDRREEHTGCRSWLELPVEWNGKVANPALTKAELDAITERVRSALVTA